MIERSDYMLDSLHEIYEYGLVKVVVFVCVFVRNCHTVSRIVRHIVEQNVDVITSGYDSVFTVIALFGQFTERTPDIVTIFRTISLHPLHTPWGKDGIHY